MLRKTAAIAGSIIIVAASLLVVDRRRLDLLSNVFASDSPVPILHADLLMVQPDSFLSPILTVYVTLGANAVLIQERKEAKNAHSQVCDRVAR